LALVALVALHLLAEAPHLELPGLILFLVLLLRLVVVAVVLLLVRLHQVDRVAAHLAILLQEPLERLDKDLRAVTPQMAAPVAAVLVLLAVTVLHHSPQGEPLVLVVRV
jgi:hypothetical protein